MQITNEERFEPQTSLEGALLESTLGEGRFEPRSACWLVGLDLPRLPPAAAKDEDADDRDQRLGDRDGDEDPGRSEAGRWART